MICRTHEFTEEFPRTVETRTVASVVMIAREWSYVAMCGAAALLMLAFAAEKIAGIVLDFTR